MKLLLNQSTATCFGMNSNNSIGHYVLDDVHRLVDGRIWGSVYDVVYKAVNQGVRAQVYNSSYGILWTIIHVSILNAIDHFVQFYEPLFPSV